MRVYLNKYKNHWISPYTICEKICFWREIDYDEPWVKATNRVLEPVMTGFMKVWNFFDRKIDYVHIDNWDVWSCDHTLAYIITPLLKHLRDAKCGYGFIDDEDAPEDIRSTAPGAREGLANDYDWDNFAEKRWNYVLNEMIWAFEQELDDDWEAQFTHGKPVYVDEEVEHEKYGTCYTFKQTNPDYWVDREGIKEYNERINNGMRLFGKYYRGLWD